MNNYLHKKLSAIDPVLPILILGELISLGVGELIIWFLLPFDKPSVAIGFLIGVGLAMLSSVLTAIIIGAVFSNGKKHVPKLVIAFAFRIGIAAAVVATAYFTGFCNPIAILIGMITQQVGVFMEPHFRIKKEKAMIAAAKAAGTYKAPVYRDLDAEDREAQRLKQEQEEENMDDFDKAEKAYKDQFKDKND